MVTLLTSKMSSPSAGGGGGIPRRPPPRQVAHQVGGVRGLLDHLTARTRLNPPPGGAWEGPEVVALDQAYRPAGQRLLGPRHRVAAARLIADARDEAGIFDPGLDPAHQLQVQAHRFLDEDVLARVDNRALRLALSDGGHGGG